MRLNGDRLPLVQETSGVGSVHQNHPIASYLIEVSGNISLRPAEILEKFEAIDQTEGSKTDKLKAYFDVVQNAYWKQLNIVEAKYLLDALWWFGEEVNPGNDWRNYF